MAKPEGISFGDPHVIEPIERVKKAKVGTGSGGIKLPDEGDRKIYPDGGA